MFTYEEYRGLVGLYADKFASFREAIDMREYVIMRHDVEFSVDRAFSLAKVDYQSSIPSIFFFQVMCDTYNLASYTNSVLVRKIKEDFGLEIGLHFYVSHIKEGDWPALERDLNRQLSLFSRATGYEASIFSFHRPPEWVLRRRDDYIGNCLNAYGPSFFEFCPEPSEIKYIADSQHDWRYGYPKDVKHYDKIQILTHPDEWSESGGDSVENFSLLKSELSERIVRCFLDETKHYKVTDEDTNSRK